MQADDYNGKTVLLINHTHMVSCPSGDELSLDPGVKFSSTKVTFHKSIWSNLVEGVIQYCRVVFDIFSTEKPISIVTFDDEEKIHSIWLNEDQNLDTIWNIFSHEGPPKSSSPNLDLKSLPGLSSACRLLQMLTPHQKENNCTDNKGRVVVLSMFMSNQISSWIPNILTTLEKPIDAPDEFVSDTNMFPGPRDLSNVYQAHYCFLCALLLLNNSQKEENRKLMLIIFVSASGRSGWTANDPDVRCVAITSSEWIFIDLFPSSEFSMEANEVYPKRVQLPDNISSNVQHHFFYHKLQATSQELYQGLMRLAESHYNLSSTLVQDIPMKEEANVNSGSSMYGVELLHRTEVHDLLKSAGLFEKLLIRTQSESDKSLSRPNSGFSKTLGIKWVTPKTSDANYLRFAVATYRVTVADVCHRASTCLSQFVLSGRSVALAHRIDCPSRVLPKHIDILPSCSTDEALLLTCHGSVMYIHVLATIFPMCHPRNIPLMPDLRLQSIDYRTQAFIDHVLRPSRLAPASARLNYSVLPKERARQHIERQTRYWPLMESQTLLGKNKLAGPIFEHLPKEYLEPNEVSACEEAIVNILNSIKQHVCLSDSKKTAAKRGSSGTLPVAPTLQAEAIALATEFDYILSLYSDLSAEHEQIRNFWIQSISSTKSDVSSGLNRSDGNDFSSLNLTEMIRLARTVACDQIDGSESSIPPALIKTMKSLTVLCERLRVNTDSKGVNQMHHKSSSEPKVIVTIEPADRANFIDYLEASKRPRTKTNKLDFVGVLTADAKGICQLYKNLKDKEKSVA